MGRVVNVLVKSGEQVSEIADLDTGDLVGLQVNQPIAEPLRFLASAEGKLFGALRNSGTGVEEVIVVEHGVTWVDPVRFPARYLRVDIGQPQPHDLVISLILKGNS